MLHMGTALKLAAGFPRWTFACAAVCLAAICLADGGVARGADEPAPAGKVSFYRQVRPILQRQCSGCHQAAKAGGNFVLTTHAALLKGGEQGAAVVPGKPDEGALIDNITGEKPAMPPKGPVLPKDQVALISKWIAEGAVDDTPTGLTDTVSSEHPPTYASPPLISALAFSADSSLLAVSGSHEVLVHKTDGSAPPVRLVGRSQRITSINFSPDGKLLAVTGGNPALFGEVQFWNTSDFKLARSVTVGTDTVFGGRFSDDASLFVFGCADNSARILKVADGEQTLKFDAHADWVTGSTFSKDAKHMITISRDRTMKLTIVETGQFVDNITSITPGALKGGLLALRRHPQKDELLVGGSDGEPKLYKMIRTQARVIGDDFNRLATYQALPGRVFAVDFNADGSRFVAASSDGEKGYVRVYDTAQPAPKWQLVLPRGLFSASFAPDGKTIATGGFDGLVRLLNAEDGKTVREFLPVTIESKVAAK
jgi:WD40 repeat protein/mono/diheme cytochrome c family protein